VASRALAVVATLVLLGAGVGAVVWSRHDLEPSRPDSSASAVPDRTAVVAGSVVHVEPGATFLPLGSPPDDGRTLSQQSAFNALVQDESKLSPIPATVRGYYGLLTDVGTSPPAAHREVWGFAVTKACVYSMPPVPPGQPMPTAAPPERPCRYWEFVDARTGHELGVVTQELLPD
jgi:hypothetical protein